MKFFRMTILFVLAAVVIMSCKKDKNIVPNNINEAEGLQLIKTILNNGYTVELFNKSGQLKVGYNQIYVRLTDEDGKYITTSSLNWMPLMTMNMGGMTHQHSCPFSDIQKVTGKQTLFEGYIVFIMASDGQNAYWNLKINFTSGNENIQVDDKVDVLLTESPYNKVYTSGMGSDNTTYMLALVEPQSPTNGTNDIVVALFKKGVGNDFPIVDNFKIKIDPRMPSMGNHSSTGNVDMTQGSDRFYHGKVGFSMSGYWIINLVLETGSGTTVKGEPVTGQNPESSLNFKLEF